MEKEIIKNLIRNACKKLKTKDKKLFEININERTLTHRLAVYIEKLLPKELKKEYSVDCEYNKLWLDPSSSKILQCECKYGKRSKTDNINGKSVYPDIIVHRRWELQKENNLIVIEAKKGDNARWRKKDVCKLKAYKQDPKYWYQFAFFIDFITWNNPQHNISIMNEDWELEKI